jgi:uncharacterized membrane protein
MDLVHIHLLLNHVPVIGLMIGFFILAWGMFRRSGELKDAGLMVLFVTSLVAIPVYLTGEPAEEAVEKLAGVSEQIIELHEDAAMISLVLCIAVGIAAFITLLAKRFLSETPVMLGTILVLVLSAAAGGSIAYTANLGGQVRHSEIRLAQAGTTGSETPAAEKKKDKDDDDD